MPLLVLSLGLLSEKRQPLPHQDIEAAWGRPVSAFRRQRRGRATLETAALAAVKPSLGLDNFLGG